MVFRSGSLSESKVIQAEVSGEKASTVGSLEGPVKLPQACLA